MKSAYALIVDFQEDRSDVLYEGESWYTEKVRDHLCIARDRITLSFERSGRIDLEQYVFSPKCPVRIQLYKAACFYLAVVGRLPPVISARLVQGDRVQELDRQRLTSHWEHCRIDITLDPESICHCFQRQGNICYIAMTYFLKAQLDPFSHDGFRAAWSGLNALYNNLPTGEKPKKVKTENLEKDKLNALSGFLRTHPPKLTQAYIESLPPEFWKGISWYNFIMQRKLENAEKDVFVNDYYPDKTIFSKLAGCIISIYEQREKKGGLVGKADLLKESYAHMIEQKACDLNQQTRFLVRRYCYMLRNRSFHANRPYPLFGLPDDEGNGVEAALTRILLLTIKDTIRDLSREVNGQ